MPETRVIIVVPCYNEAARLDRATFEAFATSHDDILFLFANDGSKDGTRDILESLAAANPEKIETFHLEENRGKGEVVRLAMLASMDRHPECFAVGFLDADLATPLEEIAGFIAILRQRPSIEMVFGSRVNLLGRMVRRNLTRHYVGRVFATLASWMLSLGVYDTQCGAKLFRAGDSLRSLLSDPFLSRWVFDVEILARLVKDRRGTDRPQPEDVIVEQPLQTWTDVKGSKIRAKDFFTVAGDLWRIRSRYLRGVPRRRLSP